MFKKFINGLLFGAGFGIALVIVLVIFFKFFLHSMIGGNRSAPDELVEMPPSILQPKKYLGSSGMYMSGFRDNLTGTLAEGDGEIIGSATASGEPVSGLKLRLALNGSVYSQWVTTDADGQYVVRVPFGEYKVDGFELDTSSADRVLVGKINHPLSHHISGKFWVTAGAKGRGPTLMFVDPVEKSQSKSRYPVSEDITLSWNPYYGASRYIVQIYEKPESYGFNGRKPLFDWSSRPEVEETSYNLKQHGVELKPGHFYVFQVYALDEYGEMLSETYDLYPGYDFEVTE
jgi:hypothetical protein